MHSIFREDGATIATKAEAIHPGFGFLSILICRYLCLKLNLTLASEVADAGCIANMAMIIPNASKKESNFLLVFFILFPS